MTTTVVRNIISCLFYTFQINDKFSVSTLHEILEQKKVKGSASKANKDCQTLLFDVHVVHRTPKVSFLRHISEDNGEQMVSLVRSSVQLLYSTTKAVVLCRFRRRPCILKSQMTQSRPAVEHFSFRTYPRFYNHLNFSNY